MIAPVTSPDPTRCPQCAAPLTGGGACASCGLRLTGPEAGRLWEVDTALHRLDTARGPLLAERAALLVALRGEPAAVAPLPAPASPEWTPQRTSNALLGLGGLLLAVAALVFTAVTYERLGAGGRAAVLLALTALAALAVPRAQRRGLRSTAETLTAVTLVLAALDAYGLRELGFGDGTDPLVFAAGASAVLAALSGAFGAAVPVRLAPAAAVVLSQLPVLLLLAHAQPSASRAGLVLAGLAAADVAALALLRGRRWAAAEVLPVLSSCAALVTTGALLLSTAGALDDEERAGALGLLGCAAVLVAGAALVRDRLARLLLSALPVGVVALAAHAVARPELAEVQSPLVPIAVALLVVQGVALLPLVLRTGPVMGALAVAAAALAAVAEPVLEGVVAPLGWLLEPWSLPAGLDARGALAPGVPWEGSAVTLVVVTAAAVAVAGGGLALHRLRTAAVPAAALAACAAVLVPVGLDLPWGAGLGVLLVLGAAALLAPRPRLLDLPLATGGAALLLLTAAWSLAGQNATLVVLPLAATALAVRALRPAAARPAVGLAGLLAAGELAALGAAHGLAADQVGGLLVLAVGALAALPLTGGRRLGAEAAACLTALAALACAVGDAGWLSWVLAGLALLALATALRADRRPAAVAGALLLSASSWVRLADAGVTDPEPYVLPVAALALVLGHLRRRAVPGTGSFAAYGPGLTALLLPSLLASYLGSPLWRPLSLAVVAVGVVLLGARERLQGPLVVGGAVLIADAVLLLAPYAAALPRWLALGAAGMLLVVVGATYEQRLRDLGRLRERYDALA